LNGQGPKAPASSYWGKVSLVAGAVACVLPLPLFGLKAQTLTGPEEGVLLGLFVASMAISSLLGSRRPLLGVLAVPACFFGLSALACWYIASLRPR